MQIVIDIPNENYQVILTKIMLACSGCKVTELPERHGRLIDADAFIKTLEDASNRQKYKELVVDDFLTVDDIFKAVIESLQNKGLAEGDSPTIIEANRSEEECR